MDRIDIFIILLSMSLAILSVSDLLDTDTLVTP